MTKKPIVGPWIDMKEYNKLKKENKALKKQLKEAITYIMIKAIFEEEFEKITNNILEGKIKNERTKK
jgi:hypothetical protein